MQYSYTGIAVNVNGLSLPPFTFPAAKMRRVVSAAAILLIARPHEGAPIVSAQTMVHDSDPIKPCRNEHTACTDWARRGECEANEGFMRTQCALACDSCGWINPSCTGANAPAKVNGGIDATFEALVARPELRATVLSRPPKGPWVVTLDRFVSDDEAAAFIETTDHHFQRSLAGDIVSPVRTSQQVRRWAFFFALPCAGSCVRAAPLHVCVLPARRAAAPSRCPPCPPRLGANLASPTRAIRTRWSTACTTAWST